MVAACRAWTIACVLSSVGGAGAARLRLGRATTEAQGLKKDFKLKMVNFQNVQYFGDFTVGGQSLPVIYDTGSFEIIVLSTLCKKCAQGPAMYNPKLSKTLKDDHLVAQHVFGSGPVTSQKGQELCQVGLGGSPLRAQQMPFWQVLDHDIDVWDKHSQFSGIVGLGHSAHTPQMDGQNATKALPQDVVLLERLGVNAFSICLERASGTPPGWLTMGPTVEEVGISPAHRHVPVIGEIHWGVQMTSLKAGGREHFDACNPSCAAIIDSGTSLIAAPSSALKALMPVFDLIKKDCSNLDQLPDITFYLGNEKFELPPAIYVLQLSHYVDKKQNIWDGLFKPPELELVTECIPGFMQMDKRAPQYGPVWILGMPFLRYYHTTFQRKPKSVHIAYADAQCEPTKKPPSIFHQSGSFGNISSHLATVGTFAKTAAEAGVGAQATRVSLPKGTSLDHPVVRVPPWALDNSREEIDL